MANVWKIGSRWSEDGSWNSRIISIFRRSEAVFLGGYFATKFRDNVERGDYFAIADGRYIQAVARAVSYPMALNEMINRKIIKVRKGEFFDITEDFSGCYGVKVKIVDLPIEKYIYYGKRGSFFKASSISKEVVDLYEEHLSHQFDIQSHTYRIKATRTQNDGKSDIIDNHTIYNIPIYQREYSWGNEQISRFVGDIFKGFWGSEDDKAICLEPMFIGTMQLSYKKYIEKNEYQQDVIDGQQRLSTILCILKYLKLKYPHVNGLEDVRLDWLETQVNNGTEDLYLSQMLSLPSLVHLQDNVDFQLNGYLKSIMIIQESFEELTKDDDGEVLAIFGENISLFVDYILNDIYFVVVETLAGLSKTIQIFNTINNAGLDLNGNDLFKVRLYEYLHDEKGFGEDAFNEIGDIYKNVKEINSSWRKNHDYDVITIDTIRSIYKNYLISKYCLNGVLYNKSTDTFFEELFDTLLHVQSHKDMSGLKNKNVELSLEDIKRIVEVAFLWNSSEFRNTDELISYTLIEYSRYSRYTNVAYQILLSNGSPNCSDEERISQVYDCLSLLSKLFFCYSLMYSKSINEIHSFMHIVYRYTINYNQDRLELFSKIKEKIEKQNNAWFRENCIGQSIAYNRVWKNLVCILSDYLEEKKCSVPVEKMNELYSGGFDVEHIHATANEIEGTDISDDLQNSIGNLMLLEYDINRSIGSLPFNEKKERKNGGLCYSDSCYATVKRIRELRKWGKQEIIDRRKEEIDKIANFLFIK